MKTKGTLTKSARVYRATVQQTTSLSGFLDDLILAMKGLDQPLALAGQCGCCEASVPEKINRSVKSTSRALIKSVTGLGRKRSK